ncbi:MAG TPA: hypothetical protein PKD18_21585 [Saprospiraceae bacterium]|nr:hypothetical protein [Saprospiraceae bacterium]
MASNLPLTLQVVVTDHQGSGYSNRVVMGTTQLACDQNLRNVYWALVVDRTNLNVVENFTFSDNNTIPPKLTQYTTNSQYMLILSSQILLTASIPAGQFYAYLLQLGAGPQLQSIEQFYQTLGCGNWVYLNYTMITVFGSGEAIEYSEYKEDSVYTLELVPVPATNGVMYTPSLY